MDLDNKERSTRTLDALLRACGGILLILVFAILSRTLAPPMAEQAHTTQETPQQTHRCLREQYCLIEDLGCANTNLVCRNHFWQPMDCIEGNHCTSGVICTDTQHRTLTCVDARLVQPIVEIQQSR